MPGEVELHELHLQLLELCFWHTELQPAIAQRNIVTRGCKYAVKYSFY